MNRDRGVFAALERLLHAIPPASGAVVMGTGIVSLDLVLDGYDALSLVPLVVAAASWGVLGLLLVGRFLLDRRRFEREALSPAALTGVAGTAVLGTRLTLLGWEWAGISMLLIAGLLWLGLLGPVLRHWVTPTIGVSFVLVVSTQALAVLSATLGITEHAGWMVDLAVVPLVLGLLLYAFVLARFEMRQLVIGRGDHWVVGGALAISALACAKVTQGAQALSVLGGAHGALRAATLAVWAAALCWLPVLVIAELASRRLGYDVRRWSTLFPVGMYAACSFATGAVAEVTPITDFARVWVWVALAVWLAVFAAMLWQAVPLARGARGSVTGDRQGEIARRRSRQEGR